MCRAHGEPWDHTTILPFLEACVCGNLRDFARYLVVDPDANLWAGLALAAGGAVVGILLALAISRWMLRTGRWQHIVPVEKPVRTS